MSVHTLNLFLTPKKLIQCSVLPEWYTVLAWHYWMRSCGFYVKPWGQEFIRFSMYYCLLAILGQRDTMTPCYLLSNFRSRACGCLSLSRCLKIFARSKHVFSLSPVLEQSWTFLSENFQNFSLNLLLYKTLEKSYNLNLASERNSWRSFLSLIRKTNSKYFKPSCF